MDESLVEQNSLGRAGTTAHKFIHARLMVEPAQNMMAVGGGNGPAALVGPDAMHQIAMPPVEPRALRLRGGIEELPEKRPLRARRENAHDRPAGQGSRRHRPGRVIGGVSAITAFIQ